MISLKSNEHSFMEKLNETGCVTGIAIDFLANIKSAMKAKKRVEFLWFSIPENNDIFYTGTITDVYVSKSILSTKFPFLIFEINMDGEDILVQTPPISVGTIEANNNSLNKYYFVDKLIAECAESKLDSRLRITIF